MKKVTENNVREMAFTESAILRNEAVKSNDADFLDKIKAVQYLTDDMILSVEQIADYYEVSRDSIKTIIKRNRLEFEEDGMKVLTGEDLKEFKKSLIGSSEPNKINRSFTILTKRSLLRVGLILTNCAMATKIRNYLLNLEEVATKEQKEWSIMREVGKIDRKKMSKALVTYLPKSVNKRFAFPNYTNMIYRAIFGKEAKVLREERSVRTNDLLRDSFTGKELEMVDEAETIITALISLGFSYEQIKIHINDKFKNQLTV